MSNTNTDTDTSHAHTQRQPQSQSQIPLFLRPATESDLPSCHAIYRHYVLHTTIAFLLHDPPLKYISDRYHAAQAHCLPYLVAVAATVAADSPFPEPSTATTTSTTNSTITTSSNTETTTNNSNTDTSTSITKDKILGFAHASPFSASKAGYAPSVEITLFCAPEHLGQGIGSALLTQLLAELRTCRNLHWEEGHERSDYEEKAVAGVEMPVRNVFAVVSQDVARQDARGEEIVDWYCGRFGFELVGRLHGVGWKFGREVDVVYLQKRLIT